MGQIKLIFYQETDDSVPVLEWLRSLSPKARDKCRVKLGRLAEMGHELRRPEADLLRDRIYELRVSLNGIHYRILYFLHGGTAAIIAHGIVKESAVPNIEITRALERKKRFEANPVKHTYQTEQS
ncbi:MAG: type II toxin-antitoxin system RelE/ParE family toxin [Verrucomicrobiaceae bacterium]|nr:MAG: type II toxin-antitoxin system RelE/ParE family toxin [Verrucomicrobiaceae bacterium]